MNVTPDEESTELRQAFVSFERAARLLSRSQDQLRKRVEGLEAELLEARRRLETVIDAADSGIAVLDETAHILQANALFHRWELGDSFEDFLGQPIRHWIRARTGLPFRHELRFGARELAATCVAVGDDRSSFVLTLKDVTSIRLESAEDGRRRRLEALGRMAAELAHELRNPLGSMRLFAGMLHDDLRELPDQRQMVDQILSGVAGLETTVSNLLGFASARPLRLDPLDLADLVRRTCDWVAPTCSVRGVRLNGPPDGQHAAVLGETEALRQLVLNLLSNALAATADGGRVSADIDAAATTVTLRIRDDGRGIPAEDLPRVFDPFFSRTEGGTGLGLSIVHRIVEQLGGTIAIESEPNAGTEVSVTLPGALETT